MCNKCGKPVKKKGAFIISPPQKDDDFGGCDIVVKYHICLHCWGGLWDWLQGDYDV